MFPKARHLPVDAIATGLRAEFERDVVSGDIEQFAGVSGDWNPLHVDAEYAATTGYGGPIAHGAFQVSLASAMAGMHLPGQRCLLMDVSARFPAPLRLPARVRVVGEVTSWNAQTQTGRLKVVIARIDNGLSTAEVLFTFGVHAADRDAATAPLAPSPIVAGSGRPTIVVTGATGGIGRGLVANLADDHDILACGWRSSPPADWSGVPGIQPLQLDLSGNRWKDELAAALTGRNVYGIVHAAWPGAPKGGLLDQSADSIARQFHFAATLVELARVLVSARPEGGGRLIAISSVVASVSLNPALGAYALGKSALETSVKLLAGELGRHRITVNAVAPAAVPEGINSGMSDHQKRMETAKIPLGRLATVQDVIHAVRYLLSFDAGFVSGQVLGLTGGRV